MIDLEIIKELMSDEVVKKLEKENIDISIIADEDLVPDKDDRNIMEKFFRKLDSNGIIAREAARKKDNTLKSDEIVQKEKMNAEHWIKIIKLFIILGINVNMKMWSMRGKIPIHMAVVMNDLELVKLLVQNGAHVNNRDSYDETPLIKAIRRNNIEMVKYLVNNGANVNDVTANGQTPLSIAHIYRYFDIEKILKSHGAK